MARIAGVDIPNNKRVEIALTYIYGIGLTTSKKIISENMDKLNLIVDYLVAYEIMDEDQFNAVFEENCNMETLEKMREEKTERIRVANEKRREELKVNEEKKEEPKDSDEKEDVVPH